MTTIGMHYDVIGGKEEEFEKGFLATLEYLKSQKGHVESHLYEDVARAFDETLDWGEPGVDFTECQTEEVRSGRQETRTCCVITAPEGIRDASLWAGLTAIVMVISQRVDASRQYIVDDFPPLHR